MDDPRGDAKQNESTNNMEPVKWTDNVNLVFTLVLVIVSLVQIILWQKANKTAEDALEASKSANLASIAANEQTKRSVDAFVEAERGRLILLSGAIAEHPDYPGIKCVTLTYVNVGSALVMFRFFGVHFVDMVFGGFQPTRNFDPEHGQFIVLFPKERLDLTPESLGLAATKIPDKFVNPDGTLESFTAEMKVSYESIGTLWCFYTGWTHWANASPKGSAVMVSRGWDLDIPIQSEDIERKKRASNPHKFP